MQESIIELAHNSGLPFCYSCNINSDTKCRIKRDDLFIALNTEVSGGVLNRISRLVGVHIDLQALGFGVVGRFDLKMM